ncbi:MAG: hypothetical protein AABZ80_00805 [Gemmatimonadota bacterium]
MLSVLGLTAQLMVAVPVDTPPPAPRPRVKAVEVSDWYNRRLTLHRRLSYAAIPVFAFQWTAGQQVWEKGTAAPAWARTGHRIGAGTVATIFTVNTVTGLLNLWDSRSAPQGRKQRYFHAISMMVANTGFTWAGAVLSEQAETDFSKRTLHRKVALTSMGISVASGVLMKYFNK